jgi:hypothetical protein
MKSKQDEAQLMKMLIERGYAMKKSYWYSYWYNESDGSVTGDLY